MTLAAAVQPDEPEVPTLRSQVAEEVRSWMARRRVSGAQLARELQRSQTFVQKRLDGRQAFDVDDLEAVARILNVPAQAFLAPDYVTASSTTNRRNPGGSHRRLHLLPTPPALPGEASERCGTDVAHLRAA